MSDVPPPIPPSSGLFFRVWLAVGMQSFGGGIATLALIRRAVVQRQGWMTEEEFARDWSLCQIAPGINLIALAILIGRRMAGAAGIALALAGLLLPSVTLTILLTAFYAHVHRSEIVQAALRGVIPATAGLGLLTSLQIVRPLLAACRREGRIGLLWGGAALGGSGIVFALAQPPVILVLFAGAALGALAVWHLRRDGEEAPR